jgi:hypothetical protein
MSCAETPIEVLLKGVTFYLNPLNHKLKLRMKTPIVGVHVKNMNYVLVMNEYKY